MKCFNCGNNIFFEGKDEKTMLPFGVVYGDSSRLSVGDNSVYVCSKCGNVQIFNKRAVEDYKKQVEELDKKKEELKELKKELDKLKQQSFDAKKYYKKIECVKKEIEELHRLGVEGKAIGSREDEIRDLENEIKRGIDHGVANRIGNLNDKIRELEIDIEKIERQRYTTVKF